MWIEERNGKFKFIERYEDYLTGQKKRVSITLEKNTAQTRKLAQQTLNEMIEKTYCKTETKDITLRNLIEAYRKDQEITVKKSTYKRNYFACDTIMRILGEQTLVSRLTAQIVREKFLATGKTPGTLNEHLRRFKALIRWGYQNDLLDNITFLDKIGSFKDIPHKQKIQNKYLESSEFKKLLDSMTIEPWRLLTEFMVLSGLRFGEAAALLKTDVDFKNRLIHVNTTYDHINKTVTVPKTSCSIREVYMQDELIQCCHEINKCMLRQKMVNCITDTQNLFFFSETGTHIHYAAFNKYLRENSKRVLNKYITTHALRHTHASLLMEKGVSIDAISRRLGHEDSRITKEIYLHVTEKLKEKDNMQIAKINIL